MKYILFVIDGVADDPIAALDGKTPLEYADNAALNELCSQGLAGTALTTPAGCSPGTEAAFLTVFGADARGASRASLEAAGMGITLEEGETGMRANVVAVENGKMLSHCAGTVNDEEAAEIVQAINSDPELARELAANNLRLIVGESYRQILAVKGEAPQATPPHNILGEDYRGYMIEQWAPLMTHISEKMESLPLNDRRRKEGRMVANMLWPWGGGKNAKVWNIRERYGVDGAAVAGVPIVKGIARLSGMQAPHVEGANGEPDTNWQGKVEAGIQTLKEKDFLLLHLEAPDELAHAGDAQGKAASIAIAGEMIHRVKQSLTDDYRIMLLSDHYTHCANRSHGPEPTPFCLYDSRCPEGCGKPFTENTCNQGVRVGGEALLDMLFEK